LLPRLDELEQKDWDLARTLVRRCGGLGLFGINVAEQYGGVDLDKVSSLVVSERFAKTASFAATFGAQANLCILPIYLFGTDAKNTRWGCSGRRRRRSSCRMRRCLRRTCLARSARGTRSRSTR